MQDILTKVRERRFTKRVSTQSLDADVNRQQSVVTGLTRKATAAETKLTEAKKAMEKAQDHYKEVEASLAQETYALNELLAKQGDEAKSRMAKGKRRGAKGNEANRDDESDAEILLADSPQSATWLEREIQAMKAVLGKAEAMLHARNNTVAEMTEKKDRAARENELKDEEWKKAGKGGSRARSRSPVKEQEDEKKIAEEIALRDKLVRTVANIKERLETMQQGSKTYNTAQAQAPALVDDADLL